MYFSLTKSYTHPTFRRVKHFYSGLYYIAVLSIKADRHDDVSRKLEPTASEGPPDRRHFALYALTHRDLRGVIFAGIF